MVVWARNVANDHGLFWATYTNQAWSVPEHYQNALPFCRSHHVDLAVQPGGDRMVAGLFDLGDMVERVGAGIWNGDSCEDGTELDSQARDVDDAALEEWMGAVAMDAQGQALLVYADTVAGDLHYFVNDAAGGWTPPAGVTLLELGLVESVVLQPMASGIGHHDGDDHGRGPVAFRGVPQFPVDQPRRASGDHTHQPSAIQL